MTWITDTVAELGVRTAQTAVAQPSVALQTQGNTPQLTIPSASGKQRTPWGKKLAGLVFGSDNDRHGNHDVNDADGKKQADRLTAARVAIDEQITRGTAAKVTIPSKGGRQLDGNFFSAEGHNLRDPANNAAPDTSRPVVLFLSGSGGTAEGYGTDVAEFYQESGASMLGVNFGGYGGSTGGAPSEQSLLEDGQAMLKHLLDLGYTEDKIIMHGFSMGGAVAGKLQAHNEKNGMQLRGLMLDRPMVSVSGGVEAHGFDAVDEAVEGTGFAKPALGALGKGAVKVVSALTRKSTGTISARKALSKNHSDTRVIVSGDQGRFADQGAALRAKLKTRDPNRSVTGAASGADHMEADPMIAQNDQSMRTMIATPPANAGPQVHFASGLSDAEKKSTRKLREKMKTRVEEIEAEVKRAEEDVMRLQGLIAKSPKPLGAPIMNHVSNKVGQVRASLAQAFADANEFARALNPLLDPITSNKIANQRKKLRQIEKNLNEAAEATGGAPAYGADVVEAELAHAADMLAKFNAIPLNARNGTSYPELQLIASNVLLTKMRNPGGVVFAGADAQAVQNVRDAAGDIQMAIARARRQPPQAPLSQAQVALTDSVKIQPRRRERAKLTASLS